MGLGGGQEDPWVSASPRASCHPNSAHTPNARAPQSHHLERDVLEAQQSPTNLSPSSWGLLPWPCCCLPPKPVSPLGSVRRHSPAALSWAPRRLCHPSCQNPSPPRSPAGSPACSSATGGQEPAQMPRSCLRGAPQRPQQCSSVEGLLKDPILSHSSGSQTPSWVSPSSRQIPAPQNPPAQHHPTK